MNTMNQAISEIGVVPVIKLNNPERDAAPLAKALCAGGVPVAEVTFRAAGAPLAIKVMKETCPDMIVGAGTVTAAAQIDEAIEAGTDGTYLDVAVLQGIVELVYSICQSSASHFYACDTICFHEVQFLCECLARCDAFLKAEV